MNTILRHIEYLASRRPCVIIPGFGAVLASSVPAVYDNERGLMLPPRREFAFNPDIRSNDGILVHSIALSKGITYEQALSIVSLEADTMRHQLKLYGELPLGKFGVLTYDSAEDTISFTPFATDRISVATAWLSPVRAIPVMQQAKNLTDEADDNATPPPFITPFRRAMRVAASLALMLGICFVASTPISVSEDVTYASLAPEVRQTSVEELVPSSPELPAPQPLILVKSTGNDLWIDVEPKHVTNTATPDKYCVIVASLASQQEADRFMTNYPNLALGIIEKDGRFRVYAASAPTMNEALNASAELSSIFPSAWVCRR